MSSFVDMTDIFPVGKHLHYAGMPPCADCEAENQAFEAMQDKYTAYQLASKIMKTKAFRDWRGFRPFDDYDKPVSLEQLMELGFEATEVGPNLEEAYISQESYAELRQTLTHKQLEVMDKLVAGYGSKEIAAENGYRSTGGVRYHKHAIRAKYRELTTGDEPNNEAHKPEDA